MKLTLADLQAIGSWIGAHSNKLSAAARACYMAIVALGWSHLSVEQVGAIALAGESVLAVFVESTTVSKVRVGERIDAEVARKMGTGSGG